MQPENSLLGFDLAAPHRLPGRIHRSMVLSKFKVRRGEVLGNTVCCPDEVVYYSLYMTMFWSMG